MMMMMMMIIKDFRQATTTIMRVIINNIQFIIYSDSDLDFQRIPQKRGGGDCKKLKGDDDRPEINRDNVQNIFRVDV